MLWFIGGVAVTVYALMVFNIEHGKHERRGEPRYRKELRRQ